MAKANASANKPNKAPAGDRELSKQGVAVATLLMNAMMEGSRASWWNLSPSLQITFRNPQKGFILGHYEYTIRFSGAALEVYKRGDIFRPSLRTRDPAAALAFMSSAAGGNAYPVLVKVECRGGMGASSRGGSCSCSCPDTAFWDIRTQPPKNGNNRLASAVASSNRLNNRLANANAVASVVASRL